MRLTCSGDGREKPNKLGWAVAIEGGNWPTPTCADQYTDKLKSSQQKEGSMHSVNLSQAVGMNWNKQEQQCEENGGASCSPMSSEKMDLNHAQDAESSTDNANAQAPHRKPTMALNTNTFSEVVSCTQGRQWATPGARDWKDSPGMAKTGTNPDGSERSREDQLPRQVSGALNPEWEEPLMCWPIGWTNLEPLPVLNWPFRDRGAFVAKRGLPQHEWEPPRTCGKIPNRNARVKAIGNGQDPSALTLAVRLLTTMKLPFTKAA